MREGFGYPLKTKGAISAHGCYEAPTKEELLAFLEYVNPDIWKFYEGRTLDKLVPYYGVEYYKMNWVKGEKNGQDIL